MSATGLNLEQAETSLSKTSQFAIKFGLYLDFKISN
jgi:hypothetical protein